MPPGASGATAGHRDVMDIYPLVLALLGFAFLGAAWLPRLVYDRPLSFPFLYIALGYLLFSLPLGLRLPNPLESGFYTEHFTEILVIISLTGAGLKLGRPLGRRRWAGTWRLLLIAMPACIALTALLGGWLLGLAPAAALLLGAVLAPTDPVLASDVQLGSPGEDEDEDEVRFALTSEAGLNDGLAFPFTYLAIALAAGGGSLAERIGEWALFDLLYRVAAGVLVGAALGFLLALFLFRLPASSAISGSRDGFVVVALTLLPYGVAELLHGYGFLAVFVAALTVRLSQRTHAYHRELHDFAEGLERMLMAVMLILFGGLLAEGLLRGLDWRVALAGLAVALVIRPLTAYPALAGVGLERDERWAIAFFGIRGIGSLYYLAFALNTIAVDGSASLWRTVAFTILASVVVHGGSASFVMRRLERRRSRAGARGPAAEAGSERPSRLRLR